MNEGMREQVRLATGDREHPWCTRRVNQFINHNFIRSSVVKSFVIKTKPKLNPKPKKHAYNTHHEPLLSAATAS